MSRCKLVVDGAWALALTCDQQELANPQLEPVLTGADHAAAWERRNAVEHCPLFCRETFLWPWVLEPAADSHPISFL